ncbi:hypothetical protein ACL02U_01160 [Streptomyces sp. MS06]|uniref:hypothetical protein n=1 Tax=Streptomyces sp. MS06 TaxID=3385974 RepID=UPI0039A39DBB
MPLPDPAVRAAVHRRAQGRRRVGKTTRWVLATAVAGTAALGAGYAHAIPGTHPAPASTTPDNGTSSTQGGLRAPGQAPGTTSQAPQTQSGAS